MTLIDIHSHLYPRFYLDALKRRDMPPRIVGDIGSERFVIFAGEHGRPIGPEWWELERKLAFMDEHGIALTVASLGNPWLDCFADAAEAEALTDEANAYFAGLGAATDGRIVGLGVLPQHDVDAAAAAVRRIAAHPNLAGAINGCRLCGFALDDPALEPIWAELESAGLPLFIHPHYVVGSEALQGFGHAFPVSIGFPFETTAAIARLVFGGVLQRHPALVLVGAHGGGTIPFLAGRLDAGWQSDGSVRERLPVPPSNDFGKLFLDALVYHPGALRAVETLVGVEQMAFGTDHPFSVSDPGANLRAIDATFTGPDRDAVRFESARRLFGLR